MPLDNVFLLIKSDNLVLTDEIRLPNLCVLGISHKITPDLEVNVIRSINDKEFP